ncbi:MAG: NYN domain-containing protein [Verrucomicrobiales bacterium]
MAEKQKLRTALFIDFDNIFIQLQKQDEDLAERFGTHPGEWLEWLETQMPWSHIDPDLVGRNILVRRCYLNPRSFHWMRPYFIRAAFEVIDCPPLTAGGKTSADIHMVMDMLEFLEHRTRFDEFIIFSGDADFTPVLLKLRKHDRRTAVLAVGTASPAYTSASDYLIDQDHFCADALWEEYRADTRTLPPSAPAKPAAAPPSPAPLPAPAAPAAKAEPPAESASEAAAASAEPAAEPELALPPPTPEQRALLDQFSEFVRGFVRTSETPVSMATIASELKRKFEDELRGSEWLGYGSFKGLLAQLTLGEIQLVFEMPGYLYDPAHHDKPASRIGFTERHPDIAPLAKKIHQLTDTPYLLPEQYTKVMEAIAGEINANGYHLTSVSKAVRDRCKEMRIPLGRQQVNFILRGIAFAGHRFGEDAAEDPRQLAAVFTENVVALCGSAQFDLSDEDRDLVRRWIG